PYGARVVADVREYQQQHSADLIVVHSTVPVGTCDQNGWVHSPVRGRHPELREGVETFVKHFGGKRAGEAARIFRDAGVATMTHSQAADTEAGKIWELAQYGLQIRVEKEFHAWCEARGIDFEVAYTRMAQTYNEGYSKLGFDHFVRPILEHVPGAIGGHCVREDAWMLDTPIGDVGETGGWGWYLACCMRSGTARRWRWSCNGLLASGSAYIQAGHSICGIRPAGGHFGIKTCSIAPPSGHRSLMSGNGA